MLFFRMIIFLLKELNEIWNKIIKEISINCDLIYFDKIPEFIIGKLTHIGESYKFYQYSYHKFRKFN